jgi:hypothetical protein
MKKTILSLILSLFTFLGYSQFLGMANNSFVPGDFYTSFYRTNSPLNTIGNRMDIINWRDSCRDAHWFSTKIRLVNIAGQTAGAVPGNIMWLDASDSGRIKVSNTLASSVITNSLGFTPVSPTTLSGYATTSALTGGLAAKQDVFAGTALQYVKGDGSLATFPTNLSSFTNGPGYIANVTSGMVTSALGFNPVNPNGLSSQYIAGDGTKVAFPTLTSGTVTSVGLSSVDFSVSGSPITTSGNITAILATTGVSAGTYGSRYTVDTKGRITSAQNKAFNSVSRSLSTTGSNNTFTISATRDAFVNYTVSFSVALLAALSNAVVDLDYSLDGGSTWVNVSSVSQVFGVSITITTTQRSSLSGWIPAGALVRIYNSSNTNATTTLVANRQQETLD